jgi:hypothetical protein
MISAEITGVPSHASNRAKAGWSVETFVSAQELLARPSVFVPNCLVVDFALPGLNGLDLQKRYPSNALECRLFLSRATGIFALRRSVLEMASDREDLNRKFIRQFTVGDFEGALLQNSGESGVLPIVTRKGPPGANH